MKKISQIVSDKHATSRGVTAFEMIIVLVIIGLLAAFAIPQLISARRLMKFSGIQQQLVASLRDARQLAMSERRKVTLRYDDNSKLLRTYELPIVPAPPVSVDVLGPQGDPRNRIVSLTDNGLLASDIVYGAPGAAPTTLADTSSITNPISGFVDVTFNPRGDVIDVATGQLDNNKALFFYENNSKTAFAVSILAPGGRIRIWKYNGTIYQ